MRLRLIYLLLFYLTFISCQKQKLDIRYYPSKDLHKKSKIVNLDLDTTNLNFLEITGKVRQIYKENKVPLIEVFDKGTNKRIIPLVFDEIRKRDVLSITTDSILIDNGYSITELKTILKRHYSNNGKDYHYPRSYKKAIIEVAIDTSKKGEDLKKSLLNLTRVFDEINKEIKDTIELRIFFNCFRQIPPPPLPLEPY
ncbi:hypothetical protein GCM10023311_14160 [Flaviramulus aquimarinus]|uniref:Uncharacterized protein n=1 Tax=Flaviramulus aquimarinus TaxID=1170456 RepID=A0ABP9EZS0_9FLAO